MTPLGHIPELKSFRGEGNVTSIMEASWQGTEIQTGLEDLRNLFSSCINIYRVANVDKALGDTEMSLACPFPGGVSSYSINNKKAEGVKCHKRRAGKVLGELFRAQRRNLPRFCCPVISTSFLWLFLRVDTEKCHTR